MLLLNVLLYLVCHIQLKAISMLQVPAETNAASSRALIKDFDTQIVKLVLKYSLRSCVTHIIQWGVRLYDLIVRSTNISTLIQYTFCGLHFKSYKLIIKQVKCISLSLHVASVCECLKINYRRVCIYSNTKIPHTSFIQCLLQ